MTEHRLYRGQPKKYCDDPLAPSALRSGCITNLENFLCFQFGIKTQQYKLKCCKPNMKSHQYNDCAAEAFYAFWLSLVNCVTTYNTYVVKTSPENNPFKCQFFVCPPVYDNGERIPLYKNGKFNYCYGENEKSIPMGMSNISDPDEIAEGCFEFAESFFNPNNLIEPLQWLLPDYAYFQHSNFLLSEQYTKKYKAIYGGDPENQYEKFVFPTLGLDWTWDNDMAIEFANKDGNKGTIMSISFEKYKKWSQIGRPDVIEVKGLCDKNGQPLPFQDNRIPILGMETYRNTDDFDDETPIRWGSENNKWMIEQKAAIIFWPFQYTQDKLIKQNEEHKGLGYELDFRIECCGME
jgi:hypothetical protein